MADISVFKETNDIRIRGGDLVFTSDDSFARTMAERINAALLTFLGEWFLDNQDQPQVGVPYFQSLFAEKLPTIELADTIFRTYILNIDGVLAVENMSFEYDEITRVLQVGFRSQIDGGFIEDIVDLQQVITSSSDTESLSLQQRSFQRGLNRSRL